MSKKRVVIVKGKKVSLVIPEREDAILWYHGLNDLEINQFLSFGHNLVSLESEEEYYNSLKDKKDEIHFGIYVNETKKIIGNISLHPVHFHKQASFGIMIFDKENQEKGYGTESLKLFLDYAFRVQGLRKVHGVCYSSNERALHVYKKVGFQEVGRLKNHSWKQGKYVDHILIEVFKEEFYEKNKSPI